MGIGHLLSIKDDKHQLRVELTDLEYYAIGYVTVHWAYLEHTLLWRTVELAHNAEIPLPEHAKSHSFKKRLRAYRALVRRTVRQPRQAKLLRVASRIGELERSRHRITHGLWEPTEKNADKLMSSSFRPGMEFTEPFDAKKLLEIGSRIGQVIFDLTYPRGKKQALVALAREWKERGGLVSRDALLSPEAKGSLGLRRVVPIQPTSIQFLPEWPSKPADEKK